MYHSHTLSWKIPEYGKKTFVHWARYPSGKAVIFIHGFNGSPTKTWADFPKLFLDSPALNGYDLFFYGYDSLYVQTNTNANLFCQFLQQLFHDPCTLINKNIGASHQRSHTFKYSKTLIVAHSLGSVICRRALLDANKENCKWVSNVSMVLFAPAHHGARVQQLAYEALFPPALKILGLVARYQIVTLDDLIPGSIVLNSIVEETRAIQSQATASDCFTIAKCVIWAENEKIVYNHPFLNDPRAKIYLGKNHFSLCKPNKTFKYPIQEVIENL